MAVIAYQNFDLLVTRSDTRYRAFVMDAPGGDADATFDLPFTTEEIGFLDDLAGVRRGSGLAKGEAISDLKELGGLLYGAVFEGKMAAVLATSLEKAEAEQIGLRLRLRFSEDTSDLATLPWEILYDPVQERFLALSESSPILRYLSLPKARPTLLIKPPLRALAVLASPPGYEELDLEKEWQVLERALSGLVADRKFVLDRLERPTFAALQERLLGEDIHILHFVGHGVYDKTASTGALILDDTDGAAQEISGEELATLLHNHRSLRLVYLNACEGALSSHLSVFSGVAQTLVQQGVPAAVAMQAEITDESAIELSRLFYSAIAAGYPVDAALTQARIAIAARGAEWAIPVLFSRSPDNRLFDVVEVLPVPDCPYPGMVPFSEQQADVFFGRDNEIADAVGRLRQHPFLTVIGPSGSGKSSLVDAGIIPALRRSRRFGVGEWTVRVFRPGDKPIAALSEALNTETEEVKDRSFDQRTLLFVDQFEELFTLAEAPEIQRFLDAINDLIGKPNLHILLTVRADFYPELMASSIWHPLRANRLELTPLGDEELRAAILQPAAHVGVTVDEALAERLVSDAAGESGALPLMQETLVLLWEKVDRRHLALQAYTDMAQGNRNGLQVAIDHRANNLYNNILTDEMRYIARNIFLQLVLMNDRQADTRRQRLVESVRPVHIDETLFRTTLNAIASHRLITLSGAEADQTVLVDISHEALITGWELLKTWTAENREALLFRQRLESRMQVWTERPKDMTTLLQGTQLLIAEGWIERNPELFTASQQEYIESSVEYRRQEQLANRRRQQMFLSLVIAIAVLLIPGTFVGANTWMYSQQKRANWQPITGFPSHVILSVAKSKVQVSGSTTRTCVGTNHIGIGCSDDGVSWNLYQVGLPTGTSDWFSSRDRLWGYLRGGAWSGRVKAVMSLSIDLSDANHIVAFVDGEGLFRSTSGGTQWTSIVTQTGKLDFRTWQSAKVWIYGDHIIAGSGVNGDQAGQLHISHDAGRSWKSIDSDHVAGRINDFVVTSVEESGSIELLLSSQTGLFRTNTESLDLVKIADSPENEQLYWLAFEEKNQQINVAAYNPSEKRGYVYGWKKESGQLVKWGTGESGAIRAIAIDSTFTTDDSIWMLFESGQVFSVQEEGDFISHGSRPGWPWSQTNRIWFGPNSTQQTEANIPYLGSSDGILQCLSCTQRTH